VNEVVNRVEEGKKEDGWGEHIVGAGLFCAVLLHRAQTQ
jgi:hypothetical protein